MKRWIFIASLTALLLLTVISAVVLRHSILEEKINRSGAVILAVLFVLALLTTLASNEVIPWGKRSLEHWRQPRVLGALGGALLLAFSALFSLTPLLSRKEELREQHDAEQYQSVGWVVPDGLTRSMGSAGQGSVWTLSGTLFLSGDAAQIDDSTSLWLLPGSGQTWSGLDLTAALDHSAVGNLHPFATAVPPGQIEGTIVLCLLRPHPMLRPRYGVRQAFNARHVSDDRIDLVPASEPTAFPDHGAGCPP